MSEMTLDKLTFSHFEPDIIEGHAIFHSHTYLHERAITHGLKVCPEPAGALPHLQSLFLSDELFKVQ